MTSSRVKAQLWVSLFAFTVINPFAALFVNDLFPPFTRYEVLSGLLTGMLFVLPVAAVVGLAVQARRLAQFPTSAFFGAVLYIVPLEYLILVFTLMGGYN